MTHKNLFLSSLKNCKYLFKNGKEAHFISGEYLTDIKSEIDELEEEVKLKHPHIYTDLDKLTVDTTKLDPLEEIKKKAVEEYLAAQSKAVDLGTTDTSSNLSGIGNTTDMSQAISGDVKVNTASLASLKASLKS